MNKLEGRKLEELKQKRIAIFAPCKNTALYKIMSINSSKVQDVYGVKELMEAVNDYEDFIDAITKEYEKEQVIGTDNFKEAEKRLNKISKCVDNINWNTPC